MAVSSTEQNATYAAPPVVEGWGRRATLVGIAALVIAAIVALLLPPAGITGVQQLFRSYLVAFFFCTGLAVGSLAWLMVGHLAGGAWALIIRRVLEAATRTLPLLALLFIPLAIGIPYLYEWAHHDAIVRNGQVIDQALYHKTTYLNVPFFIGRAVFYFAAWIALAYFFNKWSGEQDRSGDPRLRRRLQDISGPGLLLFGLTVTFAGVDWGMSLEPHWFSTIYGLIVMAGWGLSALAFSITVTSFLSAHEPYETVYAPRHFHDYGKLLLAMVMLYAYFSFSQFLIIWSGNLPEEIPFYLRRLRGFWQYVGLALILFHFALPFALLLSRGLKRSSRLLRRVAVLMLIMRVIDLVYLFAPAVHKASEQHDAGLSPVDFVTMFGMTIGLGGIWLTYFFMQLRKRPLLPLQARGLDEALAAAEHHH